MYPNLTDERLRPDRQSFALVLTLFAAPQSGLGPRPHSVQYIEVRRRDQPGSMSEWTTICGSFSRRTYGGSVMLAGSPRTISPPRRVLAGAILLKLRLARPSTPASRSSGGWLRPWMPSLLNSSGDQSGTVKDSRPVWRSLNSSEGFHAWRAV
jgi:hypothetical protein